MSKHTPGPWAISNAYGGGTAIWISSKSGAPMVLQGAQCLRSDTAKYEQISVDQLQANARLIAATPELLGALQVMLRDYAAVHDIGDVEMQPAIYQARAAIAKATGNN